MRDDAVSPVIAVMLLLAVGVTFFAAWNAYFVPSMKAQSEITHIRDVENGFLKFSSDIETAASRNGNLKLSEPIPLGGGDFVFDPVKSGGELRVWNTSMPEYLHLNWTSGTGPVSQDQVFGLIKFSYKPANNFWQDQGYGWSYGNVYVLNTERNLSTPLKFATMDDVTYGLAGSLVKLDSVPSYASPGNCSSITVTAIDLVPDRLHSRVSGNGNGMLALERVTKEERVVNATGLNIGIGPSLPGRLQSSLWDSLNQSIEDSLATCANIQRTGPYDPDKREIQLTFRTYPYPNMTVIRETAGITVGVY